MAKSTEKADGKKDPRDHGGKDAKDGKDGASQSWREARDARDAVKEIPRDPARESALNRAVQQIEKQFGKGAVMKLDGNVKATVDGIPTGSLSLDIALGGTGVPRGRVLEIYGP